VAPPVPPPVRRQGIARSGGPARASAADGGVRPTLRGFQQANVNAAGDGGAVEGENGASGSAGDENKFADLKQSGSDSLVVNGRGSGGWTLPQQNDWFGFGRGLDSGFGPGGPGGPGQFGGPGNPAAADGSAGVVVGPGQPGRGGPGGGPGGRGGGFGGGFGG